MVGLPLVVSTVGLVASSTHLGTPANALYVATGIGRSPLSNEVACALAFLAVTGVFWLYSFAKEPNELVMKVFSVVVALLGLVCVGGISMAYNQETIATWATWFTPVGIWLGGLAAGVPLFLLVVYLSHACESLGRFEPMLLGVGIVAFVANTAVSVIQYLSVSALANEILSVHELAPHFPAYIAAYVLCTALAYVLCGSVLMTRTRKLSQVDGEAAQGVSRKRGSRLLIATVLGLIGFLALRFAFYMIHMTVGISL